MLLGAPVNRQPEHEPHEADYAREYEGPTPTEMCCDPRNRKWGNNRAYIRTRIEKARGESALFFRKPLRDSLDRRGKVSRFPDTQHRTGHTEAKCRACECVAHRGQTPPDDRHRIPNARADAIHQAARD